MNKKLINFVFQVLTASVMLCNILGALCIVLNFFIIIMLIRNRNKVLSNVFYVIVLHCAIVDLIRGCCLMAWGLPHLLMNKKPTMNDRLLALKVAVVLQGYQKILHSV